MLIRAVKDESEANQVAEWTFDEWGRDAPGYSIEKAGEIYRARVSSKVIPLTLVALDPEPVGTASLVECDMAAHPELTPWLASVYVRSDRRGQGIGEALCKGVLAEARRLGFNRCYLFTDKEEPFYAKRGWKAISREKHRVGDVVVMERMISADFHESPHK